MFKSKILHKTMLLMAVLISGYIGAILIHAFPKINNKVSSLEKINIEELLNKIVAISKISYKNLEDFKQKTLKSHHINLKNTALLPAYILEHYYGQYKNGLLSEKDAKKLASDEIGSLIYPNNGNFFLIDNNHKLIFDANRKYLKDANFTKQIVNEESREGEAFFEYFSQNSEKIVSKKLGYIKSFKPWGIYFGTEECIDNLAIEIKKRENNLLEKLNNIIKISNIRKIGSSFIFNEKGEVIIYQDRSMKNINLHTLQNPLTKNSLYDDFTKVAKTTKVLNYDWNRPTDEDHYIYEKILWIDYVPELQWYIATTSYKKEFEVMSNKLQKIIGSLGLIVFIIALIISFVFFKKLLQPISTLSNMASSAIKGDYSVRSNIKSNDEIGQLSKNFNIMIETIEKNIQKEKQIMEQSRLAQMGEIMSMIAHQWRQPLGAISSAVINIQMKMRMKKYDFENKEDTLLFLNLLNKKLSSIEEYVQFLSTTIDDFRTFFKQNNTKELLALTIPVNKALRMIEASLTSKNIKITKSFQTNDELLIYKNELIQVILNILKNSEDNFIENNIANPTINISTKKDTDKYIVSIIDNGGGVSDRILSKIFEPYFSTKLEKNGTGLGLYMSKVIIEEHHNGVFQATNVENGINFEIILYK